MEIVQPPEGSTTALIGAGGAEFGISFQDTLAKSFAKENPVPVTAVAAILQHNTSGIISLKEKGIDSPKKLEGKKYATWEDNIEQAILKKLVTDDKGDFSLWLGEAKFYNDIADERMYEPINSVFDTISTDKIKKENSIITSIKDLEYVIPDPDVRKNVQTILRRDTSIDEIRKRLHVPILLLHECKITNDATKLTDNYLNDIKDFHLNRAQKYFVSQNNKQEKENIYGYENIQFHLILFPVPQKEDIVNCFIERAKQIKEDA